MKKYILIVSILVVTVLALLAISIIPSKALGLGIAPAEVLVKVDSEYGPEEMIFVVTQYTGNLYITLEDIPLSIEPEVVEITEEQQIITVDLYGDSELGDQEYEGYIVFTGLSEEKQGVGVRVKVIATVHNVVRDSTGEYNWAAYVISGICAIGLGFIIYPFIRRWRRYAKANHNRNTSSGNGNRP